MAYCTHLDENGEPCGNAAKEEYGNRYCGIHKASYYIEVIEGLEEKLSMTQAKLDASVDERESALSRMRMANYTSKESKISTALLWVGSLSAAAFAGALATYLIL